MNETILILMVLFFSFSCAKRTNGFAPSAPSTEPPPLEGPGSPSGSYQIFVKTAETVVTGLGWSLTVDTIDSVKTVNLFNGWVVEARYE